MNQLTIVGELKEDAKIVNGNYNFMACTIIERRTGYGQNAGKVFKRFVKAIMFGKEINDLAPRLKKGRIVEAIGEADAEAYIPKQGDGKPKAVVVVKGTIKPLLMSDDAPAAAPAAPTPSSNDMDDVPF